MEMNFGWEGTGYIPTRSVGMCNFNCSKKKYNKNNIIKLFT